LQIDPESDWIESRLLSLQANQPTDRNVAIPKSEELGMLKLIDGMKMSLEGKID
jgi:hypothetical protein